MNSSNQEIALVQNPAIGSIALWRFICGYYSTQSLATPLPLLFIVLPIVFRSDLRDTIVHTQKNSGLSKFAEKLGANKNVNQLYSIHYSAEQYKFLSLKSLHIAEASKLVFVDVQYANVIPFLQTTQKMTSADAQKIVEAAERLGLWCSYLSMHEVSAMLKVRF